MYLKKIEATGVVGRSFQLSTLELQVLAEQREVIQQHQAIKAELEELSGSNEDGMMEKRRNLRNELNAMETKVLQATENLFSFIDHMCKDVQTRADVAKDLFGSEGFKEEQK